MRLEEVYKDLLRKKIVDTDDITASVSRLTNLKTRPQHVHNKYIRPLMEKDLMVRVRRGLYYVNSPGESEEISKTDKFLIASKVRSDYYISHHAALEMHGSAQSAFWTVHISTPPEGRFEPFQFREVRFQGVSTKDVWEGIITFSWRGTSIKTSNPSRTFIDCVDRPELAGGWEECLKSLQSLPGVSANEIIELISVIGKDTLFNKVGYVLDLMRDSSVYYEHISEEDMGMIQKKVTRNPTHLQKGEMTIESKRWNLYVKNDFQKYLRGV